MDAHILPNIEDVFLDLLLAGTHTLLLCCVMGAVFTNNKTNGFCMKYSKASALLAANRLVVMEAFRPHSVIKRKREKT